MNTVKANFGISDIELVRAFPLDSKLHQLALCGVVPLKKMNLLKPHIMQAIIEMSQFLLNQWKNAGAEDDYLIKTAAPGCYTINMGNILYRLDIRIDMLKNCIYKLDIVQKLSKQYGDRFSIVESGAVVLEHGAPGANIHTDYAPALWSGMFIYAKLSQLRTLIFSIKNLCVYCLN